LIPILFDLHHKKILVIGGGKIATRKVRRLSKEMADITVIAPDISQTIVNLISAHKCYHRPYQTGDASQFDMIFICSSDKLTNAQIISEIQPYQLVNDTTDRQNSNFFSMAELMFEDILIAMSSKGTKPAKMKKMKEKLRLLLHEEN
jgi:precorrin-2 dehydrogenase/sirohydrochlorin ferrochelatase